jgi:polysaccharide export outer membrane protein
MIGAAGQPARSQAAGGTYRGSSRGVGTPNESVPSAAQANGQVVRASYSQPVAGMSANPNVIPPQFSVQPGYVASGPYASPMAVAGPSPPMGRPAGGIPRELSKVVLPRYKIEPPDILVVEAIHIVPRAPYRLRPFDVIDLQVTGTLPEEPVAGAYTVQPEGVIRLGFSYGSVSIADMTVDEAKEAIEQHLRRFLKEPVASVGLSQISAVQQIAGEHLVGPDGTVTLGSYGSVPVVGMTLGEAKAAIESYLTRFLEDPEVSVDVYAYNSKVYYVIAEGAGLGDRVYRFPITGNETVLDAISQIQGLDFISSTRMWIARPSPNPAQFQILPVDWKSVTAQAATGSNYQLLPGDRLFIAQDPNVALDTVVGKVLSPWERVMGFVTLGVGTVTRLSGPVLKGGGNPQGYGGF